MHPRARFIFNPRSGHNARNPWLLERARAFVAEHRLDAIVVPTERPHHATELARRALDEGCRLVVAIGGDGTMNEVATALIGTGAALGLIPCGSGNGLGRHLGIPGPGKGAFRALLGGHTRLIDTGLADGHPFFNAMGLGFDAEISSRFNALTRRGLTAYARTTLGALRAYRPDHYTIHADGRPAIDTEAWIVAVANSDQYGNDCFIAPGARVDDGRLDLTVLRRLTALGAAPLAARLFTGRLRESANVHRRQAASYVIARRTPGLLHTDGEVRACAAEVDVRVLPASLRIVVPAEKVP
ncbi:MAG: diacylglycerol kinase family lipid kinase [Opitutaceae bacterium]|jgi:YegS/Rv2252/BmrU family lipid kinase|nr:diacylglycerol kinase family lipid kinase [Opitutaceae bacterium]